MPANNYGEVTNLTQKPIFTEAYPGGIDGNEVDPEGNYRYELPVGQAVMIMTKMDQEWFLKFPERYEVQVKGKTLSKATIESVRASAHAKGEEVLKSGAKSAKA